MRCVEGLTLPHRPPDGRVDRLAVRALYFHGPIDPEQFRPQNPDDAVVAADPLVVAPGPGGFALLAKFGVAVFWSCSDDVERAVVAAVHRMPAGPHGVGPRGRVRGGRRER